MSSHYVYVIVNKINLKLYFGSHSWEGTGVDKNYYGSGKIIKQAVRKYGKDNFIVYPIKFYDTIEECRQAEEELLRKHNIANNPYCYNIKNGAIGWTSEDMKGEKNPNYGKNFSDEHRKKLSQALKGKKPTDATRQKLSQARKGKTFSEEHKKNLAQSRKNLMTPVVAIQIDTGKIRVFESIMECTKQLNLHLGHIYNCLKGRQKTCKGYIIKYLKRCSTDYKITKRKAKKTEKVKLTTKRKGTTPIVAIQKDTGRARMFLSQNECARKLSLYQSSIYQCLTGRRNHTGGYTFKKINRDKRVFTVSQRSKADLNVLRGIAE